MRVIGYLQGEQAARRFGDYLLTQGIESQIELESEELWAIWILDEELFAKAKSHLKRYETDPEAPRFEVASQKAKAIRQEDEAKTDLWRQRQKRLNFRPRIDLKSNKLTLCLFIVCIGIFALEKLLPEAQWNSLFRWLIISNFLSGGEDGLTEVREQGQIWRLFTPCLIHIYFFHLLFNLWCLKDLGAILESKLGMPSFACLIVSVGVGSNLAQYFFSQSPNIMGISGIIFGLLGFILGKWLYDPGFGLVMPTFVLGIMAIWLTLGFFQPFAGAGVFLANASHLSGLILGVVAALLPIWKARW